jgi:hypothetical protein
VTAHVASLGPVGRIGISANFDLEDIQIGPIARLEEIIQNFVLLKKSPSVYMTHRAQTFLP